MWSRVRDDVWLQRLRAVSLPRSRYGWLQMFTIVGPRVDRRKLLTGSASVAAAVSLPHLLRGASAPIREFHLTAAPARLPIVGRPYSDTDVWCYGGRVPGPEIRAPPGQPVRMTAANTRSGDTPLHWHGIPLPTATAAVPCLTHPP